MHIEQSPLAIYVFKGDCAELTGLMFSICILSRSDPLPFPVSSCSDGGLGSKQPAVFWQEFPPDPSDSARRCGAPCSTTQAVLCYQLGVPPPPPGDRVQSPRLRAHSSRTHPPPFTTSKARSPVLPTYLGYRSSDSPHFLGFD